MTAEVPAASLDAQAGQIKLAAEQLRAQVKEEFAAAQRVGHPDAYREALVRIRSLQDTLEEYVAFARAVKGGLERAAADAKEAYDMAWSQEASRPGSTAPEYEGARERYAKFDVRVFAQLRAHRQAEQSARLADELLDEMQLRYRAVNATRQDISDILRAYAFIGSLEH